MAAFPQEQQPATVELPTIDVKPEELAPPPPGPPSVTVAGAASQPGDPNGDPWAAFPDVKEPPSRKGVPQITVRPSDAAASGSVPPPTPTPDDPWNAFPDEVPPKLPKKPKGPEVTTPQAVLTGIAHGASFGTAPALAGLSEVADEPIKQLEQNLDIKPGSTHVAPHVRAALGAAEMLTNWMTGQKDPGVQEAYERGRKAAREREESADEQHRWAYLSGVMAGTIATPGGTMTPALKGGRFVQGALQGGAGGGLFGAGEAIGEGKSLPEVGKAGVKGGVIGAPVGGAFGTVLGPRATTGVGARAAATARDLGESIPRGYASENPRVQSTTAKVAQMPFAGEEIPGQVLRTGTAAGERIRGIAEGMSGGRPERAVAQQAVRPGLEHVIEQNERRIDSAYDALRAQIKLGQRFTMPNTDRALNEVMRRRADAGWPDPAQGLEKIRAVAGGAPYEGAHRARHEARKAGDVANPHPGYDAGDFNYIVRAMTGDIRNIVSNAASNNTPAGRAAALRAFDDAERQFGPLAEQNRFFKSLMDMSGEGGIAKLLQSATEKKGNLALLAQARAGMQPDEFRQIGGLLLHEIGSMPSVESGFSLSKFSTEWRNISDGAKRVLFAPEHVQNLNDIASMGYHLKHAARETTTSHSAGMLVLFEMAQAAASLGYGAATGDMTTGMAVAGGTAAASWVLTRWLASPAPAAAMGAWTRAYRAVTFGQPTPARVATFNIATRNLANTLGVPVEKVAEIVASKVGLKAEPGQEENLKQK